MSDPTRLERFSWVPCTASVNGLDGLVVAALFLISGNPGIAATNLVSNPSFEAFSVCPLIENDVNGYVDSWIQASLASSDYFNACNTGTSGCYVDVPDNFGGTQPALSGLAYGGFFHYGEHPSGSLVDQREYLEVPLTAPLATGVEYDITFSVSLAEGSEFEVQEIGAHLSPTALTAADALPSGGGAGTGPIPVVPHYEHTGSFLNDTDNWVPLSGRFTADGDEEWLTLGNFNSDVSTTVQAHPGSGCTCCGLSGFAYYYVDDVCLVEVEPNPIQRMDVVVSIFETTDFVIVHSYASDDPALLAQLAGPLSGGNSDFAGAFGEYYDVFYSDAAGTFDPLGSYLTIEATWDMQAPVGGGLNIAGAYLDAGGSARWANVVSSFVALGSYVPGSESFALGPNLDDHSTMGNTAPGDPQRLRLTLGFTSPDCPVPVPEPSVLWGLAIGSAFISALSRRKSSR